MCHHDYLWKVPKLSTLRGRGINQGLKHMFGRIIFQGSVPTPQITYVMCLTKNKKKQVNFVQGNKLYLLLEYYKKKYIYSVDKMRRFCTSGRHCLQLLLSFKRLNH